MITEEDFQGAVDNLCNEINGSRTSIEMGEWADRLDMFSVEIANWNFGINGSPLTLGGWVEIDCERENISCLLGLIYTNCKGKKKNIGECEGLLGFYDTESKQWELDWDLF